MVHAELHDAVVGSQVYLRFHDAEDSFVDHRHQYPVGNESGQILAVNRYLFHKTLVDSLARKVSLAVAMSPNHFHQIHHRHRIHEVHADNFVRSS